MADKIEDFEVNSERWFSLEDFEGEVWKDVPDYEGWYQVSNYGRIKSIGRNRNCLNGGKALVKNRILKCTNRCGYTRVRFCVNYNIREENIHRIVAKSFLPNPYGFPEVDHINTIKNDNRVSNLRWVSHIENSYNSNTIKITGTPVLLYEENSIMAEFPSIKAAERVLHIHRNVIRDLLNHKRKRSKYIIDLRYKYPKEERIGNRN